MGTQGHPQIPPSPTQWTHADVEAFLPRAIPPVRPGPFYYLGLVLVAVSLLVLQSLYLAMVGLAGYATFRYVTAIPVIFDGMSVNFLTVLLLITPLVAGCIVTFFLLKPLLARSPAATELLRLDPAAEPVLYSFVHRICRQVGSPTPTRIDIDLSANASASLRRGWRSLFSHDLVLTLGLPLVAGLDVRQFAGVVAHEFGHFSQHAGMRLHFLIATIRHWFARVAYQRDSWDESLDEWRSTSGWRTKVVLNIAWATVQASRDILRGLLYCASIVSAWFSRQMEFDADRHAAALVGAECFGGALAALPVLSVAVENSWQTVNRTWRSKELCDDFALLVNHVAISLSATQRDDLISADLAEVTGRWATHPCTTERLAAMHGISGVATAATVPSSVLFADFEQLSRSATLHAYNLSLGEGAAEANLRPTPAVIEATRAETRRSEALATFLGPVSMPARWFRLPTDQGKDLVVALSDFDESGRYWSLLEESLSRHAALEFIRAGGKVQAASFQLSGSEPDDVIREAGESRDALSGEITRLQTRYLANGQLMLKTPVEWRDAYTSLAEAQPDFLHLRHLVATANLMQANLAMLPGISGPVALDAQRHHIGRTCDALCHRFASVPCPALDEGTITQTLADQLRLSGPGQLSPEDYAARVLERSDWLGATLLGEICARAV